MIQKSSKTVKHFYLHSENQLKIMADASRYQRPELFTQDVKIVQRGDIIDCVGDGITSSV